MFMKPPPIQQENWEPRESFSASAISVFLLCRRKWAFGYLFGWKDGAPKPGTTLGSLIHASCEAFERGGTVFDFVVTDEIKKELDTFDPVVRARLLEEAPKRALAGIHLIPDGEFQEIETDIQIDTSLVLPEIEPVVFKGRIDLRTYDEGRWTVTDHKSTRGARVEGKFDPWAYAHTPETLAADVQAVIYSLDTLQNWEGVASVDLRWIYYLTDDNCTPKAKPVDSIITDPVGASVKYILIADEMRSILRSRPCPEDLPEGPLEACSAYGGCAFREDRGGPCRRQDSVTALAMAIARSTMPLAQLHRGKKQMALASKMTDASSLIAQANARKAAAAAAAANPHGVATVYPIPPKAPAPAKAAVAPAPAPAPTQPAVAPAAPGRGRPKGPGRPRKAIQVVEQTEVTTEELEPIDGSAPEEGGAPQEVDLEAFAAQVRSEVEAEFRKTISQLENALLKANGAVSAPVVSNINPVAPEDILTVIGMCEDRLTSISFHPSGALAQLVFAPESSEGLGNAP